MNLLLNLLFPRRCLGCGKLGKYFCRQCRIKIQPCEGQICPICERPAIGGATHPRCQTRYALDGLTSFWPYQGLVKKAIKELKYRLVSDLASELISLTPLKDMKLQNQSLIAVPLHVKRENWRGFNQTDLLGKMIAQNLTLPFISDFLVRIKNTEPQITLSGKQRQENIRGAFSFNHNSEFIIHNSSILLFDDVWTTGATLRTCGAVLKKAGAKWVWGLTLAR